MSKNVINIRVTSKTRDLLRAMKRGGETYDDVIQRVVNAYAKGQYAKIMAEEAKT